MTIQPQLIYVWIDQSIITDENVQISSHFDALHNLFTNSVEYLTLSRIL